MSDDSNPFKKLATLFQSAEKTDESSRTSKIRTAQGRSGKGEQGRKPSSPQGPGGSAPEDDADTALFFHAVSNIKPLGGSGRGTKRTEPEEALAHRMTAAQKAKAGDDDFAAAVAGQGGERARTDKRPVRPGEAQARQQGPVDAQGKAMSSVPSMAPVSPVPPVPKDTSDASAQREFLDALSAGADAKAGAAAGQAAAQDAELFSSAMKGVRPVNGKGREIAASPGAKSSVAAPDPAKALRDLLQGKVEFALQHSGEYLEGYVVGMDPAIMARLRAGQYSPEKHLDLHGMNAMQACDALTWFIKDAYQKGLRTVVVVTGRGKNSPDGVGVLRPLLSQWLCKDPFKRVVLAFCTARPHDGGPGAIYVALRKYKKSRGKIVWELPEEQ